MEVLAASTRATMRGRESARRRVPGVQADHAVRAGEDPWVLQKRPHPHSHPEQHEEDPHVRFAVAEYDTIPGRPSFVWTTTTLRGSAGS